MFAHWLSESWSVWSSTVAQRCTCKVALRCIFFVFCQVGRAGFKFSETEMKCPIQNCAIFADLFRIQRKSNILKAGLRRLVVATCIERRSEIGRRRRHEEQAGNRSSRRRKHERAATGHAIADKYRSCHSRRGRGDKIKEQPETSQTTREEGGGRIMCVIAPARQGPTTQEGGGERGISSCSTFEDQAGNPHHSSRSSQ
jgi:hypothetical protein